MNDFQAYCNRLLKDLISIPSFNEAQFPGMQEFILDELRKLGCEAMNDETSGCIIGRKDVNKNARGIPTFVFGPGECDQVHQADEYITFERVVECADIISGFLEAK